MEISWELNGNKINMCTNEIGNDICVLIYGGDVPHIGAVALAHRSEVAHQLNRKTTTVSVMTLPGHKEDVLAKNIAVNLSKLLEKNVIVSCGIHIYKLDRDKIQHFSDHIEDMSIKYVEAYVKKKDGKI